jgi:hypothetical protein
MIYYVTIEYATLRQMKDLVSTFFENGNVDGHPEKFNVRKNHLIVTDLVTKRVRVWYFHYIVGRYALTLVMDAERLKGMTTKDVILLVENGLRDGHLPALPNYY